MSLAVISMFLLLRPGFVHCDMAGFSLFCGFVVMAAVAAALALLLLLPLLHGANGIDDCDEYYYEYDYDVDHSCP